MLAPVLMFLWITQIVMHAARIIFRKKYAELDKQTAKTLNILPFKLIKLKYNVLRIFKNFSNNHSSVYLDSELLSAISAYSKRCADAHKFNMLKHKRSVDEYCFQFASITGWNCLPNNLRSCTDFKLFNSKLTDFVHNLLVQFLYCVILYKTKTFIFLLIYFWF